MQAILLSGRGQARVCRSGAYGAHTAAAMPPRWRDQGGDKLLLDAPQEATCHAGSCEVYGYGAAGGHWSQVVELTPELSNGEAFRQTPHLPEGWVQGTNLSMKERPLSTHSFPVR